MEAFLLKYFTFITHFAEVLAAVTGLVLYKHYKLSNAKYFIWFLVGVALGDIFGGYAYLVYYGYIPFLKGTVLEWNYWWYTIYWKIGAILFLAFYYHKNLNNSRFKLILKYTAIAFLLFSLGYIGFNFTAFFKRSFPVISIFGAVIVFLCTIFYFFEVLHSNTVLSFYKSINFYVSAAIFIWWLIITPLVFYDIYNSQEDWNFVFLKWQIYLFANLSMYLTFTFALIFCKNELKKH
ncbi:membrane protein [Tamlana nanhaiensis]|uniref:Membrane protein n=1 Tax=Neotamlana nanhaiensis TaxID=1382798 RepID=A0A0D7W5Y7_9FLAO|nr:hypothetical protein [Tamlana nanhaiensis]KJD34551.1 membrane protein [Tamlana nanhaiensis]